MAITKQYNTPKKYDTGYRSILLDSRTAQGSSGTFNGVAYIAAGGPATLFNKHSFLSFDSSGSPASQRQCAHWCVRLPEDYKPNTDLKFRFVWTENSNTGQVQWQIGLTKLNAGVLGGEAQTEYQNAFQNGTGIPNVTFDPQLSPVYTFNGSGLNPNDVVNLMIFRDGSADAHSEIAYVNYAEVLYQSDRLEQLPESNIVRSRKTPKTFKTVRKSIYIRPEKSHAGGADTWNGVAVVAAGVAVLTDRWYTQLLSNGTNDSFSCQFIVPYDYIEGTNFQVRIEYFQNGTGAGNFDLNVGLVKTAANGDYGDEGAETEWLQNIEASDGVTNSRQKSTFIFSGVGVTRGEKLTLAIYKLLVVHLVLEYLL